MGRPVNKLWTDEQLELFKKYARQKMSAKEIAEKMDRSPAAITAKASYLGMSLDFRKKKTKKK
jgi:predicted DNA-binding protein YlxM (UPF0122 family)